MNVLTLNLHDYPRAQRGPLPNIKIIPLPVEHMPDLQILEWEGTGLSILITPDRLRELAAVILDKFPLIAPALAAPQPDKATGEAEDIFADDVEASF